MFENIVIMDVVDWHLDIETFGPGLHHLALVVADDLADDLSTPNLWENVQ